MRSVQALQQLTLQEFWNVLYTGNSTAWSFIQGLTIPIVLLPVK